MTPRMKLLLVGDCKAIGMNIRERMAETGCECLLMEVPEDQRVVNLTKFPPESLLVEILLSNVANLHEAESVVGLIVISPDNEESKSEGEAIPICANCKRIRDEDDQWHQPEVYLRDRFQIAFTHGLCPKCAKEFREYVRDKYASRNDH